MYNDWKNFLCWTVNYIHCFFQHVTTELVSGITRTSSFLETLLLILLESPASNYQKQMLWPRRAPQGRPHFLPSCSWVTFKSWVQDGSQVEILAHCTSDKWFDALSNLLVLPVLAMAFSARLNKLSKNRSEGAFTVNPWSRKHYKAPQSKSKSWQTVNTGKDHQLVCPPASSHTDVNYPTNPWLSFQSRAAEREGFTN